MHIKRIVFGGLALAMAVAVAAPNSFAQGTRGGGGGGESGQAPQGRRGGGGGQQTTAQTPAPGAQNARPTPAPEEKSSVTHHSATIGGQKIDYTATAGTYVLKDDSGAPKATMFYVAYTKDGVDEISKRPVAFSYNGGPGSASCFVHMGFGPKRTVVSADGHGSPAPYSTVDNNESFLDAADLVFVDAISTGYSRPVAGENPAQFHGVVEDATWFSDFIYQYITRNERWDSPKYLIGESYGTTRSAQLSGILERRHEIYLNGIVLVSTVAFATADPDARAMFPFPGYAATAWYHHMLAPDLQKETVDQVVQQAREFAKGEYHAALMKGDRLSAAERQKVIAEIARFTGLSPKFIDDCNLRISSQRWFKEVERDKRRTVGRLDSRFEGMDADAAGEREEYDPSEASYEGAWVATFQDYIRRELKWETDMYYTVTAQVQPWDQTGNELVAETLRGAMTRQSYLKVLVVCGYYDFATPFFGIEYTVDHMGLEPPIRKNIIFTYYESGHMVYIDEKAHVKLHKDVDEFIRGSSTH
jgi:carboxypeptidase C (cathepsin A)